jgi:hypothetical protein
MLRRAPWSSLLLAQTLLKLTTALGVEIQFVLTETGTVPQESISLRGTVAG